MQGPEQLPIAPSGQLLLIAEEEIGLVHAVDDAVVRHRAAGDLLCLRSTRYPQNWAQRSRAC